MIHNANNSMDTAVTSSTNSMHVLNTIVAAPLPASASVLPLQTVGPTVGSIIAPATVVNNNNNNTNANHLIDEIASENYWLREKVKEINADRDRLLCEVANLRLELDMAELKRLPEDSFPQKVADRPSPAYVYMQQQQHYIPPPQQVMYQQMCHQVHSGNGHQASVHTLNKKGSIRNGDVLKRTRTQNGYELSQDLLDKQIELLERKYGGIRARHAAITIQRAFRHYTMVKKFASITAMAKAEKRLSRRLPLSTQQTQPQQQPIHSSPLAEDVLSSSYVSNVNVSAGSESDVSIGSGSQNRSACGGMVTPSSSRVAPIRSMSLRERRSMDASWSENANQVAENTSHVSGKYRIHGRSTSGNESNSPVSNATAWTKTNQHSHPHVNLLHASEQHYHSSPIQQSPYQQMQHTHQYQQHSNSYCQQDISLNSSSQIDSSHSSMNSSWSSQNQSPMQPYYSAQQIYMRPRTSTAHMIQQQNSKRVPPEVPKRTSSITLQQRGYDPTGRAIRPNGLCKTAENGSLSSVQSSGSDSSADRMHCDVGSDRSTSPQWKRKVQSPDHISSGCASADAEYLNSHTSAAQYSMEQHEPLVPTTSYKVSETIRKRQYRVGLNLFNKKPEKGITYLIRRGFLENTPQGVARFLISRKGLSRQMIGEYLGNLQNQFNMAVLECFAGELDLSGMQVDVALRKFQAYFRMPGEAQKIERLMEIFSQRYCQCNSDVIARLRSSDTIFVMAFAIIMLNTDLHTPNLKPERRMRVEDFIKNLRGIDDCHDIDRDMLVGIYERVKANEFKPGSDHMTQVMKVQATIVGKKPNLALPHRRLVCYCRLYEIPDINKKERPGVHQREVFLFNDLLVITKIFNKKKNSATYTFRVSFPLCGMVVTLLDVPNYPYCIRLSQKVDGKILVTFNARNEHDRCKFAEDLRESISEMDEMESLRIEAELERQKSARSSRNGGSASSENRDSGVADVEVCPCPYQSPQNETHTEAHLKRSALSNSLLDMHEQFVYRFSRKMPGVIY
ncbi:IQ motif and SEC7 domain-containing protein 1 isoform X1 [Contarinia nasturtii]|uniref:IQ motif and SEC7 domain-containing protein 1 isoform X1 n=3 Tax=Contarinia nasturtii TaxID=265458 RepID=UPI0012D3902B|nr:IQ motif and SEC7 domain-containing protein 1 isoform X1 [Contarinia nasturtii]